MHCKVQNDTDVPLIPLDDGLFESGEMVIKPPRKILPKTKAMFGVGGGGKTSTLGSFFKGGVCGAVTFQLENGPTFSLGFSDPAVGDLKAGAAWGDAQMAGYKVATETGNTASLGDYSIIASVTSKNRTLYVVRPAFAVSKGAWQ